MTSSVISSSSAFSVNNNTTTASNNVPLLPSQLPPALPTFWQSPLHYVTRTLRRWRRRVQFWSSPLKLRYSIIVLSKITDHPYRYLARLFLRYPRHFPVILPPPPREIIAYAPEAYMDEHHLDIFELRLIPIFRWRDTLQSSFYRLYEAFCAYDEPLIGYETEYLWKRQTHWNPEDIYDPRLDGCNDSEQLAVLASLAEALIWSPSMDISGA
ncbi:uncharacterized protein F5Z01DRAFT_677235 [Emericellopsis atlantica]|uniref:Uncharacterized protein n=1 Tax=Emericellopsis atlantica TaxID=2614577 RepID=A0A9P8CMR8_9HYPO|nr:uncharacterized protein F5Z01DRAFT_677235 [Emericellopsis atlantica]KAG9250981.1 hypothetical protein F5Z01DRAFT_677235 [Emericellopsis atlantica]